MSETVNYNGDDLLSVFNDLGIDLGKLGPNAIRGWFDTESQDMRNLLNFMCSNLSRENASTAQELDEYESIEHPLQGDELEAACEEIERDYPGIFNLDLNTQQLRISSEDSRLLKLEETQLDEKISIQEKLQLFEHQKKSKLEKENAMLDFKCEELELKNSELSQTLDSKHNELYEKLTVHLSSLSSFLFHDNSEFLNSVNLGDLEDPEEFISSIEEFVKKQQENLSSDFSLSNINLNSTPNEDNFELYKSQIYSSVMNYYLKKMDEKSLTSILNYLEDFFVNDSPRNCPRDLMESMVGRKEVLLNMLKKKALNISEEPIRQMEIGKMKKELKFAEEKLVYFSQIANYYTKVLCVISCSLMFFLREKDCVEKADEFIRNTSRYILDNLEETKERSEIMLELQKSSDDFLIKPVESKSGILQNLMKIHNGNSLKDSFVNYKKLLNNLGKLDEKYFSNNSKVLSETLSELFRNDWIRKFLTSGPTKEIVIIPNPIQRSLKNVRYNLDKQASAIKSSLGTITRTSQSLSSDEFLRDSRLLWVYFLVNPEKFLEVFRKLRDT